MSEQAKKAITPISDAMRLALRRASVLSLPDNPSAAGMDAETIKKRFWQGEQVLLKELERVIGEANEMLSDDHARMDEIEELLREVGVPLLEQAKQVAAEAQAAADRADAAAGEAIEKAEQAVEEAAGRADAAAQEIMAQAEQAADAAEAARQEAETAALELQETLERAGGGPPFTLVAQYTVAGAYTWVCPEDGEYVVLIVGGGGSGCARIYSIEACTVGTEYIAGGGHPGNINLARMTLEKDVGYDLVVGAGAPGAAVEAVYDDSAVTAVEIGSEGESSAFFEEFATGGQGGSTTRTYAVDPIIDKTSTSTQVTRVYGSMISISPYVNLLSDHDKVPAYVRVSGGNCALKKSYSYSQPEFILTSENERKDVEEYCRVFNKEWIDGTGAALTKRSEESTAILDVPNICGAGGGGLFAYIGGSDIKAGTSGAGADGGVFIYRVKEVEANEGSQD